MYYIEAEIAGKWHVVGEAKNEQLLNLLLDYWVSFGHAVDFWGW